MSESTRFLETPNRQSVIAIIIILARFLKVVARQIWPLLVIMVINPTKSWFTIFYIVAIVAAAGSAIFSIWYYFKFYFYVKDGELIIEKGILEKTKLNIPFERIQTINFQQSILHQLFDVVGLEIDTAGSGKKELSITAVEKDKAELIRDYLIRQGATQTPVINDETSAELPAVKKEELLLKLSELDLLKVGVGQNHLRGAGLLFAALLGLWQFFEDIFGDKFLEDLYVMTGIQWENIGVVFLILAPILLIIAFFISLITTVLRYFNLRFYKTDIGFKVVAGLFTRKEQSAKMQKIQKMSWTTSPLKKIFDLFDLKLSQAASSAVTRQQSIYVPGCYEPHIDSVRAEYFPEEKEIGFESFKIDKRIVGRYLLYFGIAPGLGIFLLQLAWSGDFQWFWLIIIPVVWAASTLYYEKWRYHVSELGLRVEHGVIGKKFTLLKWYKVQSVRIRQGIYQRRKGLADIHFHTAAGTVYIPYIKVEDAYALKNFVLYKVETNRLKWM
ncbi:MAG: PH domain-containing protein [Bacteroidota bacterium]